MQSSPDNSTQPPKKTTRGTGQGSSASSSSRGQGPSTRGGSVRQRDRASGESGSSAAAGSSSAEQFGISQGREPVADVVDEPQLPVERAISQRQRNTAESAQTNSLSSQARPPSSLSRRVPPPPPLQQRPSHASSAALTSSFEHISSPLASDGQRNEHAPVSRAPPTSVVTQPLVQETSRRLSSRSWSDPVELPSVLSSSPPSSRGTLAAGPRSIFRFPEADMTSLVYETARQLEMYMWTQQPFMTGREMELVCFPIAVDTRHD